MGSVGLNPGAYNANLTSALDQNFIGTGLSQIQGMQRQIEALMGKVGGPNNSDLFDLEQLEGGGNLSNVSRGRGIGDIPDPREYRRDYTDDTGLNRDDDGAHGWPEGTVTTAGGCHVEYGKDGSIKIFAAGADPDDNPMYTIRTKGGGGKPPVPDGGGTKPPVPDGGGGGKPPVPDGGGGKPPVPDGGGKPPVPDTGGGTTPSGELEILGPDGKPIPINLKNSDLVLPDGTRLAMESDKSGNMTRLNMINGDSRIPIKNDNGKWDIGDDSEDGRKWLNKHIDSHSWSRKTYQVELSKGGKPQMYEFVGEDPKGRVGPDGKLRPSKGHDSLLDPGLKEASGSPAWREKLLEELRRLQGGGDMPSPWDTGGRSQRNGGTGWDTGVDLRSQLEQLEGLEGAGRSSLQDDIQRRRGGRFDG